MSANASTEETRAEETNQANAVVNDFVNTVRESKAEKLEDLQKPLKELVGDHAAKIIFTTLEGPSEKLEDLQTPLKELVGDHAAKIIFTTLEGPLDSKYKIGIISRCFAQSLGKDACRLAAEACLDFWEKHQRFTTKATEMNEQKKRLLTALQGGHNQSNCGTQGAHCGLCHNFIDVESDEITGRWKDGIISIGEDNTHKLDKGRKRAFKKCFDDATKELANTYNIVNNKIVEFHRQFKTNNFNELEKKKVCDDYLSYVMAELSTTENESVTVDKVCYILSLMTYATTKSDPNNALTGERDLDMELINLLFIMVRCRGLDCHYGEYKSTARDVIDGKNRRVDGVILANATEDILTFESSLSKDSTTQISLSIGDDGKLRRQCIASIKREGSKHDPIALHFAKVPEGTFQLRIHQMVVGEGGLLEWHNLKTIPLTFMMSENNTAEKHRDIFAALLALTNYISVPDNYNSNNERSTVTENVDSKTPKKGPNNTNDAAGDKSKNSSGGPNSKNSSGGTNNKKRSGVTNNKKAVEVVGAGSSSSSCSHSENVNSKTPEKGPNNTNDAAGDKSKNSSGGPNSKERSGGTNNKKRSGGSGSRKTKKRKESQSEKPDTNESVQIEGLKINPTFRGWGASSHVWHGTDVKMRGEVAVKMVWKTDRFIAEVNALSILSRAGVANVSQLLYSFSSHQSDGLDYPCLVIPWYTPLDFTSMKKEETDIVEFVRNACNIVDDVHTSGITHGDIKPCAFMMNPKTGSPVLTDFGLSWSVNDSVENGDYGGTPGWIFKGSPGSRMRDGDCLALGSLVCWLIRVPCAGDEYSEYHQLSTALATYTERLSLSGESLPKRRALSKFAVQLVKLTVPQNVGTLGAAFADCLVIEE
eukprot:CAMPEP_0202473934 /NCGR_PEP_ID=MMETSP1360-20130828/92110_1 /ASSEMBLY_ACC=CAM_ASM_000848 /TAXON_ID=515479 /ORGANISM="Licmophora paradoxa, Strain CCMP2313" /LENGTH=875 /DNA_ID=CAMNT_0049101021 /DNA_START=116 /DNA_END=2741 /DNA_ORIENTATION=-